MGVAAGGAATVARAAIELVAPGVVPFALLFPATLLATLIAGWPAGVSALVFGGGATWYFLLPPHRSFAIRDTTEWLSLALYVGSSLLITVMTEAYRRSAQALAVERRQQTILIDELNHRVKNTLATVQSIARHSGKGAATVEEFQKRFEGRLMALSQTHNALTRGVWEHVPLHELLLQELTPYGQERFALQGPTVRLPARHALALGMVFHELATNAAKHGAFTAPKGQVWVSWTLDATQRRSGLSLEWKERGGPTTAAPERRGFGLRLIEGTLRGELHGEAAFDFAPGGLMVRLRSPHLGDGL